jgi:ABC-type dipeptide/oligopeptide/nickel transport systems, permease components
MTQQLHELETVRPRRRRARITSLTIGLTLVIVLVAMALLAPLLAPFDPNAQVIEQRLLAPSALHWFGTDGFGRDLLSRVIYGARPTLLLVSLILVLTIPVGLLVGITAGYVGGWTERVLMRITDIFLSLPNLVIALALVAMLGPGLMNGALALALTSWPPFARQARAETLALRRSDYLAAARMQGYYRPAPDVWPHSAALPADRRGACRAEPRRDYSFCRRAGLPRHGRTAANRRMGLDGSRRQ